MHDMQRVDLTNCDREPIHIPGAILPHGALLVVSSKSFDIVQCAGDLVGLLGKPADALLNAPLATLFSAEQVSRLRELCASANLERPRHLLDPVMRSHGGAPVDASAHKSGEALILEFERAEPSERFVAAPLEAVQEMLDGLDAAPSIEAFCARAAERVRATIGYDRVMVYRFMQDGAGHVIAEDRRDDLTPFLDLHYPASDIPAQARALYLKNWLRLIVQVDYTPAPLIPADNPLTGKPLDLSHSTLRDVSPIHREYLRNMGVDASMSISIICEGKLWGLIACHHYSPKRLARHLRAACELLGVIFSLQLEARQRASEVDARMASRAILQTLLESLSGEDNYADILARHAPNLLDYVNANGVALRARNSNGLSLLVNREVVSHGAAPEREAIVRLADWLAKRLDSNSGIFATDRLSEEWPEGAALTDTAAGVMAISVSREPRDFIFWFRPEIVQTVTWGGDPNKPVTVGPSGDRLTPRKSFEAWTQEVRGRSLPWSQLDHDAVFDLRVALLEVVLQRIEAAAAERERVRQHEALLMAELDHRVKNTLATIQSLVRQSSRGAENLQHFVKTLEARIVAMAKAHNLLTAGQWRQVPMRDLLTQELAQYGDEAILLDGPDVALTPRAALALSLAVHELATNAGKYGALSAQRGRVEVRWREAPEGLHLNWREQGGPKVVVPTKRGFGSTLIEKAMTIETGGKAKLSFHESGVACDIVLSTDALAAAPA
jgi:two-component system, chemotaxis family, sensor kinase Cph1